LETIHLFDNEFSKSAHGVSCGAIDIQEEGDDDTDTSCTTKGKAGHQHACRARGHRRCDGTPPEPRSAKRVCKNRSDSLHAKCNRLLDKFL